jgi:hypothetical protein
MPVNTPRTEYEDATLVWQRMRDCYSGRDAILKAGQRYTPKLPAATPQAQLDYMQRGNYFAALRRTVTGLIGGIFQKPPRFDVPGRVDPWLDDVTLTHIPMAAFAQEVTTEVMLMGRIGVLVELASATPYTERRPYFVSFSCENIINWQTTSVGGDDVLSLLVLRESPTERDASDPFTVKSIEQYRVLSLVDGVYTQQLYRQADESGDFEPYGDPIIPLRRGVPLPFIPFEFLAPSYASVDIKEPPLVDLANISLAHWRNSVDHEAGLHLVALPTPYVSGMRAADDSVLEIGPSTIWILDSGGSAGFVEFSGAGMGALETALEAKENQMAILGAKLLNESTSQLAPETATAVLAKTAGENASLRTLAQSAQANLRRLLQIMGWWEGLEATPADVSVDVALNQDFLQIKMSAQDATAALQMLQSDEISYQTFWDLLSNNGWGRDNVTAAEEQREISRQPQIPTPPEEVIEVERDET